MLQRAARNAYSWWWASHIRTKQSKWLDQNLQDMEEKVEYILKIINEDGDSFSMKAEMFYRKRPELVNFVEDCFRGYRALAERYDHLSKEMQNANRTIATIYPERLQQFAMEDDDENYAATVATFQEPKNPTKEFPAPPVYISPKSPTVPKKSFKSPTRLMSKRGLLKIGSTDNVVAVTSSKSGLSKAEALEEIDRLQKGILALQTEKEFVKSSYENGLEKYWEIEKKVSDMQAKVNNLQDEFGIVRVIEDDEARMLMSATALNSCQQKLTSLQEKQEQSIEEAKVESKRVEAVRKKFETMIDQLTNKQENLCGNSEDDGSSKGVKSKDLEESRNLKLVKVDIKEQLVVNGDASITLSELAEKIDELVETVINLEASVSSQNALVKILKSGSDELQEKLKSLEADKETLVKGSCNKSNKIQELDKELCRLKTFKQDVKKDNTKSESLSKDESDRNNVGSPKSLDIDNYVDNFSHKTSSLKSDAKDSFEEHQVFKDSDNELDSNTDSRTGERVKKDDNLNDRISLPSEADNILRSEHFNNHLNCPRKGEELKKQENERKMLLFTTGNGSAQELDIDEVKQTNWRELFLNNLEDRERFLLEEYTALLKSFKQVKKKLSEAEKKHRANLFKSTVQIKVLKSANASKDSQIQSLHKKLNLLQMNEDEVHKTHESPDEAKSQDSDTSSQNAVEKEASDSLQEHTDESVENTENSMATENLKISTEDTEGHVANHDEDDDINLKSVDEAPLISSIEEKIRMDLDDLLEENIEFWLRYSTSFHQVQKFQTTFEDLQTELAELKETTKQDGSLKQSDIRPIYMHLREIQAELTLWLEQNEVLEDDLQNRLSSISRIQEEISRLSNVGSDETELTDYQAAKFTGEIMNMKQENNKVADELLVGIQRVKRLKTEIEIAVTKLDDEFGFSATRNHQTRNSRYKIPLRSFLFGVKLKKQKASLLSCISPAIQRQHSDLYSVPPPV